METATTAQHTAAAPSVRGPSALSSNARIESVDFVRGVVMILMAIDHVRVYAGVPAGGPELGIFFTRWITHFVAPAFVFLAGTAAYLHGRKLESKRQLASFLFTRGIWLILLELTVIRVAWTFNLDFASYNLAGVIWMLGWCMIVLSAAVFLPTRLIGCLGIAVIVLHNITDFLQGPLQAAFADGGPPAYLKLLYFGGALTLQGDSGPPLFILYVLVPWIGVMMGGYVFGSIFALPARAQRALIMRLGIAASLAFVLIRAVDVYGDPVPWRGVEWLPATLAFLNTTKYPASLSFLLMTLGPMLILLAFAEARKGRVAQVATVFGRVPLFYYLLHIPVIHAAALAVSLVRTGTINPWLFGNHPLAPPEVPDGYQWSLWLLYAVFSACIVTLYFPSRWYARVRGRRSSRWFSYL